MFEPTARTTVRRHPERGEYEQAAVEAILDEGLVAHVGVAVDGQPFVLPMVYARVDGHLYLHGSAASRLLRTLGAGAPVCVTVTLLDGIVLARSAFHHSMNYRSVVILGRAVAVTDTAERERALAAMVDHAVPGRSEEVRAPDRRELAATLVVRVALDEVSAKVRHGPPIDDPADLEIPVWAGVLPLRLVAGDPSPDGPSDRPLPPALAAWRQEV
ncbi:MAG: pyridoxamine 5'-phosphate oxidase family protein [Actinomycetota bacterium]|nr:pyridoxamine 5'-phosphate oxidase family protein [Actinomycetota bacterium]